MIQNNKHKVFISYHHENDQGYKNEFVNMFGEYGANILVDYSVNTGDINPHIQTETIRQKIRDKYIKEATVVIVLIGRETWQRKHVDWEISAGIMKTEYNSRCGLLGIFLPTHPDYDRDKFNKYTIPPRLSDNSKDYAILCDWSRNSQYISNNIHKAFENRNGINPINNRTMFGKNRTGNSWSD